MNMRISDFCHFVDGKNNLTAIYNTLTLGVVIVDRETADLIRGGAKYKILSSEMVIALQIRGGNELIEQLAKHKLIFPLGERPDLNDYQKIQAHLACKKIGIIYLLMTDTCNLACNYCFIENAMLPEHQFSTMSTKIARFGIDLFAKALKKSSGIEEPQIILYGGEPLANLAVVKDIIEYIKTLKIESKISLNTSITINTNGTLIDEEIVSILRNVENLNVAISLDGPKEIHNLCRKYHGGRGTYDDVIKGYRMLIDNGIGAGFCCTISQYNVDHLEEISKWFVDELKAKSLGFNIMIESGKSKDVIGNIDFYARKTTQQIINCFKFFRERGVYEDRIMRKVNAFVNGYIYYRDCGGCGEQLVISPSGMVGVCQGYWG